jgi:hypothetical protein
MWEAWPYLINRRWSGSEKWELCSVCIVSVEGEWSMFFWSESGWLEVEEVGEIEAVGEVD